MERPPTEIRLEIPLGSAAFDRRAPEAEEIRWEAPNNRFVQKVVQGTLTLHYPLPAGPRPVALICPGGGYVGVSLDKEGHHLADWLSARGWVGAVLKYRLPKAPPGPLPEPVEDFFLALKAMRHAWDVDLGRVVAVGFSAGGHLAGLCALRFGELSRRSGYDGPPPVGAALIYAVASMREGYSHGGSRDNLLGTPSEEILSFFSIEEAIGPQSPPLFLVHSEDDQTVPIDNSNLLAARCAAAGVPCAFHSYPAGGHGYGMAPGRSHSEWVERFGEWLDALGQ